ncbi:hypothetical protein AMECASPLE_016857 [Ameca splendens]|uniref:Uncharacterized protein n=1 Tax=Ameca splendens TaxID=208324 RepID=A0ABV0Z127_9TELE
MVNTIITLSIYSNKALSLNKNRHEIIIIDISVSETTPLFYPFLPGCCFNGRIPLKLLSVLFDHQQKLVIKAKRQHNRVFSVVFCISVEHLFVLKTLHASIVFVCVHVKAFDEPDG